MLPILTLALLIGYPLYSLLRTRHFGTETPSHPGCVFKALSGYPCPYCGYNRSVMHLYLGEFNGSLLYHPLAMVLVGFVGYLAWRAVGSWRDGKRFGLSNREFAVFAVVTLASWGCKFAIGPDYF